jgi:hypothetical protein
VDLSRTRVVFRERGVVDVLDLALRFLVQHWRAFSVTGALVLLPFFGVSVAVARARGPYAAWTLALFASAFASAPFTILASRLVFEDDVGALAAAREGLRAAPRLLVLRLVTFVAGGFGLLLFAIPGLWFLSLTLFVVEVLVLERTGVTGSMTRSSAIVRRESAEAMMALLLLSTLHVVACLAADSGGRAIVAVILEAHEPEPIWTAGWSVLSLFGFWLFVPYAAVARFFVYLDVRTKSEGWDIQTRFVAIASRPSPDTTSARSAA